MFGIDDAIAAGSNLITTIVNKFAPDATTLGLVSDDSCGILIIDKEMGEICYL